MGAVCLLGLVGSISCRPGAEQPEAVALETEEVGGPIDAAVTTEYDIRAKSSAEIVGAELPSDFPGDVPLYGSASVINHGPADRDRHFIELSVPAQPSTVERRYNAQIEASGWRRLGDGQFERGSRTILVTYREGTPGTWVRIEYPRPS
jgi:hypothetical protein